ncbi:MAG TPA: SDR family NAD(P)-dependent oxidoreductase, partial [Bacillota bacterium]|nr:SDR family NAD(P)-dependent oxidoreductase [Bacillota bacterium]
MKQGKLHGKTVILTGAGGGIGTATAALLDREGANLVLADINLARVQELAQGLSRPALAVKCDITKREEVTELVARALERFNTIDVLVNNAGIIIPSL